MSSGSVIEPDAVGLLVDELRRRGHRVVGPRVRDGAIVHDDVTSLDDLPRGWGDEQAPGRYRLVPRDDDALFGHAVGPTSPRATLYPSRQRLFTSRRDRDGGLAITSTPPVPERLAFLGVRSCELRAVQVQDRVLLGGIVRDAVWEARRADVVFVAVSCTAPAATCFCASTGTGPAVAGDDPLADLVLTELVGDGPHVLLADARTPTGEALLAALPSRPATADDEARARAHLERAASAQERSLDLDAAHDLLLDNLEHPRWDDVAARCVTCASCTLVCPTCFCTEVEDVTSLDGTTATRERRWDSCFAMSFTHLPQGSVRSSARSRYRQWATHKLATWVDQLGEPGCVGCGRCIAWCPVGIDLTAEVDAIAATPGATDPGPRTPGPEVTT